MRFGKRSVGGLKLPWDFTHMYGRKHNYQLHCVSLPAISNWKFSRQSDTSPKLNSPASRSGYILYDNLLALCKRRLCTKIQ